MGSPTSCDEAIANSPQEEQQQQSLPLVLQNDAVNVTIKETPKLGPQPTKLVCPHCHKMTRTRIHGRSTWYTIFSSVTLFTYGLCFCCCIPYCSRSCKDVEHYCTECTKHVGTFKRG